MAKTTTPKRNKRHFGAGIKRQPERPRSPLEQLADLSTNSLNTFSDAESALRQAQQAVRGAVDGLASMVMDMITDETKRRLIEPLLFELFSERKAMVSRRLLLGIRRAHQTFEHEARQPRLPFSQDAATAAQRIKDVIGGMPQPRIRVDEALSHATFKFRRGDKITGSLPDGRYVMHATLLDQQEDGRWHIVSRMDPAVWAYLQPETIMEHFNFDFEIGDPVMVLNHYDIGSHFHGRITRIDGVDVYIQGGASAPEIQAMLNELWPDRTVA